MPPDSPNPETEPTATNLVKTLTFGVGQPLGYDRPNDALVPLDDEQRSLVYKELREESKTFASLCNVIISTEYAAQMLGVPRNELDVFKPNYKPILERLNRKTSLSGLVLSQTYVMAKAHFQGDHKKDLLGRGTRALPTHRTDGTHPVMVRADGSRLRLVEGKFYLCMNLFSKIWAEEHGLPNWFAFPLNIKPRDKSGRQQLQNVLEELWSLKNTRIFRSTRRSGPKWLVQLVVSYPRAVDPAIDPSTIMGIDRGVNNPAAIHIRPDGAPQSWALTIGDGRRMLAARNIIRGEIVRIIRALRTKNSALVGPARDGALHRLRQLRQRERRIIQTASQKIAAQIAEIVRRNGAGTWQVEALGKGIKDDSWLARNWAPGVLLDAIRWQARQLGAELVEVDPAYTSQRCSKCGHIARANRPKGKKGAEFFLCVECGHTENADKNAARNLSTPGIEELIKQFSPV